MKKFLFGDHGVNQRVIGVAEPARRMASHLRSLIALPDYQIAQFPNRGRHGPHLILYSYPKREWIFYLSSFTDIRSAGKLGIITFVLAVCADEERRGTTQKSSVNSGFVESGAGGHEFGY
ncbi:MAG TPA: hypothetical protein VLT57_03205 [Bryobacteraceae bacterium]|nr:hypothetical protein [Bryobacteraceae bacterium]